MRDRDEYRRQLKAMSDADLGLPNAGCGGFVLGFVAGLAFLAAVSWMVLR